MDVKSVTLPERNENDPDKFYWTVEFGVDKTWVADGFDLTNERAMQMLTNDLSYAYGHELSAQVLNSPDLDRIAKEQGYKDKNDPRFIKER